MHKNARLTPLCCCKVRGDRLILATKTGRELRVRHIHDRARRRGRAVEQRGVVAPERPDTVRVFRELQ